MYHTVADTATKYIAPGAAVGIALSGGVDSVVLCDILAAVCADRDAQLFALHYEHGMRGSESLRDADFVQAFCDGRGIPVHIEHAAAGQLVSEEDARRARYAFFERMAVRLGLAHIFLAHHADDRVETMLLNIIRGCGIAGLHPMPERRGIFVRPMLGVTRAQIEACARDHGLEYVTDSTNLGCDYARNTVRNSILPELRGINPGFSACANRLMQSAAADDDYIYAAARCEFQNVRRGDGSVSIDKRRLSSLHPAVAGRLVRLCVREISTLTDVESVHVDSILALCALPSGSHVDLKNGLFAQSGFERIDICAAAPEVSYAATSERIDADALPAGYTLRTPQTGDYIVPLGMSGRKLLKDYLREKKVPRELRETLCVYACGSEVYAVRGVGISERVRVTDSTVNIMQI